MSGELERFALAVARNATNAGYRPDCTPPYAHIFLDGRWRCECGALDYDDLAEVITGRPVRELLLGEPQAK